MTESASESMAPEKGRFPQFSWTLYQQVTAVLAAFGMAAIVTRIWDITWRGVLRIAIGFWDNTVRPVVESIFHYLVTVPFAWMGVEFEVPLWVRDYFSVGIILAFSYLRSIRGNRAGAWAPIGRNHIDRPIYLLVAWPIVVVYGGVTLLGRLTTTSTRLVTTLVRYRGPRRIWRQNQTDLQSLRGKNQAAIMRIAKISNKIAEATRQQAPKRGKSKSEKAKPTKTPEELHQQLVHEEDLHRYFAERIHALESAKARAEAGDQSLARTRVIQKATLATLGQFLIAICPLIYLAGLLCLNIWVL